MIILKNKKAFLYIIQKVINSQNKIYDFDPLSQSNSIRKAKKANKNNQTNKINEDVNLKKSQINFQLWRELGEHELKDNFVKFNFYQYISSSYHTSKFDYFFRYCYYNPFSNPNEKEITLNYLCKIQKIYHAFSRIAYIFKLKRSKFMSTTDLYMNDLDANDKNVLTLYHVGNKYMFVISDLIKIMNSSLHHSPHFYADPIPCKNPYNNIPFTKACLYNIYFFIRFHTSITAELIHGYFLCNFSLYKFRDKYEELIRKCGIKSYIENASEKELSYSIHCMIEKFNKWKGNKYRSKLKVHQDFPKNKLIEIMKPYLILYYNGVYSSTYDKKNYYTTMLYFKLGEFVAYNYRFGSKQFSFFGDANSAFNMHHIPFSMKKENCDFNTSHLYCDYFEDFDDEFSRWGVARPNITRTRIHNTSDGDLFVSSDSESENEDEFAVNSRQIEEFAATTSATATTEVETDDATSNSIINDNDSEFY